MTAPDTEKGWNIERYPRNIERELAPLIFQQHWYEFELTAGQSRQGLPAADMLVLVTADHVGEPTLFERFECHGCRVVVAGKKIPGLMREALPAFEPQGLGTKIQRTAMDKQHSPVSPLHGHGIEY